MGKNPFTNLLTNITHKELTRTVAITEHTQVMVPSVDVISYGQQVLENGQEIRLRSSVQCRVKQHVKTFLRIT